MRGAPEMTECRCDAWELRFSLTVPHRKCQIETWDFRPAMGLYSSARFSGKM
jgi:hypothetical protein